MMSVQGLKGTRSDSNRTEGGFASVMMSLLKIGSCLGVSSTSSPSQPIMNVALTTTVSLGLVSTSGQRKVATVKVVSLAIWRRGTGASDRSPEVTGAVIPLDGPDLSVATCTDPSWLNLATNVDPPASIRSPSAKTVSAILAPLTKVP